MLPVANMLPVAAMLPAAEMLANDITLPPVTLPLTLNEVNVPTEVILPCAAVVTVPAVVAEVAEVAVPAVNDAAVPVKPVPAPLNCNPVTAPVTEILPVDKMLPVAEMLPVMFTPSVVKTATFEVPAIEIFALPLGAVDTLVVPLVSAVGVVGMIPVNKLPSPIKYASLVTFPVAESSVMLALAAFGTSLQITLPPS